MLLLLLLRSPDLVCSHETGSIISGYKEQPKQRKRRNSNNHPGESRSQRTQAHIQRASALARSLVLKPFGVYVTVKVVKEATTKYGKVPTGAAGKAKPTRKVNGWIDGWLCRFA